MRQNKKENKNKRKNEEWIQKARHASSVKDIAHVIETMQFHRIFGLVDEQEVWDKLLILDEPTNGLDPSGIHEIRNLVKSLPSLYDCTVLISSHMLSEIELIADDIGILNHGRLLFEGSMNDLRQYALQSGFAADNLEDVFLSMVEKDNMDRKQRAKL